MRTTYLGQYTDEHADELLAALDRAGIVHWEKRSGRFTRFAFAGEWGVRVFVEADRLDDARRIAEAITS
ncbi:MAG: hypothetical protein M3N57_07465 [Actinomycetota bacterium]|nr:hypothetical protein [Actinomycetota bacterium]